MFERRLKILLMILSVVIAVLVARAAEVQIFQRVMWSAEAIDAMKRPHTVQASRGSIRDVKGRLLAVDEPCIDACVDYRAIQSPPDDEWVRQTALARLHSQLGDPYAKAPKKQRKAMVSEEIERVGNDITAMWAKLAHESGKTPEEIDSVREAITRRVEMQRRYVQFRNFQRASAKQAHSHEDLTAWKRWVLEGGSNMPDVDQFRITVAEQLEPHVILPAVGNETQNELGKNIDQYPGLVLRPGTHRFYPYHDVACHLLGQLAKVNREDLDRDAKADPGDLRAYLPNDSIGRTGIESLCEPTLRGTRGRYEKIVGDERIVSSQDPVPGQDVTLSIDIDLQQQIQTAFSDAELRGSDGKVVERALLHGAAIVIDVPTGEVRAMVSFPTYDLNTIDEQYAKLHDDDLNQPLLNRATMAQHEPGSTVKPVVGLSAIAAGLWTVDQTVECTGYLVLDKHKYSQGRCWVASRFFKELGGAVAHHPVPWDAPHPTGFLNFSDGLERSCNVFFETVADRLKVDLLSEWYSRWGLGRPTGIGIAEVRGMLPTSRHLPAWKKRAVGWFAGIGQGLVAATPIQMANIAATIARDGIWMRPTLLAGGDDAVPGVRDGSYEGVPRRVDLQIPPEAMKAAHDGMFRVVNSKAGTGTGLVKGDDLLASAMIAGKTGTAQAAPLHLIERDESGRPVLDERGKPKTQLLEPSTPSNPNLAALWYRGSGLEGKDLDHAWYIGFAPADHPQIAFAVMVEYGGSGGVAAASVAREALEGCIIRHYLTVRPLAATAGAD